MTPDGGRRAAGHRGEARRPPDRPTPPDDQWIDHAQSLAADGLSVQDIAWTLAHEHDVWLHLDEVEDVLRAGPRRDP